jgi:hypothetical protein
MRPKKQGVSVESMATFGSYQLLMADLYACPGCDREVIAGFGQPLAEHFEPGYEQKLAAERYLGPLHRYWLNLVEKQRYEKGEAVEPT